MSRPAGMTAGRSASDHGLQLLVRGGEISGIRHG
jgi:hypothetical protein